MRTEKRLNAKHTVLQTVKRRYEKALDYQSYWPVKNSSKYDEVVSSLIAKFFKMVKSKMKMYFFNRKDLISIIRFLVSFRPLCDTNCIHKGPAMWLLPHHVDATMPIALNSHICAQDKSTIIAAPVRNNDE